MNIGIDIDGVLTNLEEETINYGTKMCIENNWEININPEKYSEAERFNWTQEQEEQFWNTYLVKYIKESSSRLFADQAIKKLREEGNQIYIITARNDYGMPEDVEESMQQMTQKWLEKNNIQYDKLIFTDDSKKLEECIKNNVKIMIEDNPKNIMNISKKVTVIKYNCRYNEKIKEKNIINAYSWYHIYDIISIDK